MDNRGHRNSPKHNGYLIQVSSFPSIGFSFYLRAQSTVNQRMTWKETRKGVKIFSCNKMAEAAPGGASANLGGGLPAACPRLPLRCPTLSLFRVQNSLRKEVGQTVE